MFFRHIISKFYTKCKFRHISHHLNNHALESLSTQVFLLFFGNLFFGKYVRTIVPQENFFLHENSYTCSLPQYYHAFWYLTSAKNILFTKLYKYILKISIKFWIMLSLFFLFSKFTFRLVSMFETCHKSIKVKKKFFYFFNIHVFCHEITQHKSKTFFLIQNTTVHC